VSIREWKKTTLGELCDFINGGTWKRDEYSTEGVPVTRVTDFTGTSIDLTDCNFLPASSFSKYNKHELFEGDLVVATVGSHPTRPSSAVGRPVRVPRNAQGSLLNQNAVCIRPIDEEVLDKWFLFYFALTEKFRNYILSNARGSANQARMSITRFKELPIIVPPIEAQRKICSILTNYSKLIDNNSRRIGILEEMAQKIYLEWFTHFRFPGYQNAVFVDSSSGMIPEGWDHSTITDNHYFSLISQNAKTFEGAKRYFATADVDGTEIVGNGKEYTFDEKPSRAQKIPEIFSVWFARMRDSYKLLAITEANSEMTSNTILSSGFAGFRAINEDSFPFLYSQINSHRFHKLKDAQCTGATQQSLTNVGLSKIESIVPDKEIVMMFSRLTMPMINQCIILRKKNNNLLRFLDFLIPRLISGELDVTDIGIKVTV